MRGTVLGNWLQKSVWVLGLICAVLVSFILAKLTWLVVIDQFFDKALIPISSPQAENSKNNLSSQDTLDINKILGHNIFDANETILTVTPETTSTQVVKEEPLLPPDQQVAIKTTLPIKLKATVSFGDGTTPQSSCAIVGEGSKMKTYWIGKKEMFASSVTITKILPKRVEFLNKGRLEYVELDELSKEEVETKLTQSKALKKDDEKEAKEEPSEIKQEGDVFKIPKKEFDRALSKVTDLYSDIRAKPHEVDGKTVGWMLSSIKPGSLFSKLGLRRGDVLKTINGRTVDASSAIETLNSLKSEKNFEVVLERRRQEQVFKYEIVE